MSFSLRETLARKSKFMITPAAKRSRFRTFRRAYWSIATRAASSCRPCSGRRPKLQRRNQRDEEHHAASRRRGREPGNQFGDISNDEKFIAFAKPNTTSDWSLDAWPRDPSSVASKTRRVSQRLAGGRAKRHRRTHAIARYAPQRGASPEAGMFLTPPIQCVTVTTLHRWCRFAQPPATSFQAFGLSFYKT